MKRFEKLIFIGFLPRFSFCEWDRKLGFNSMQFRAFPDTFLFPKIKIRTLFHNLHGNQRFKRLLLMTSSFSVGVERNCTETSKCLKIYVTNIVDQHFYSFPKAFQIQLLAHIGICSYWPYLLTRLLGHFLWFSFWNMQKVVIAEIETT